MSLVQMIKIFLSLVLQQRDGFSLRSKHLPGLPFPFTKKGTPIHINLYFKEEKTTIKVCYCALRNNEMQNLSFYLFVSVDTLRKAEGD